MRILYDASQSTREAVIARELADALKQGKAVSLFVPEQYTLETERWLSQALRGTPRLKLDIVSFNRLAHRMVDGKRGSARKLLNHSGTLMALQRIILDHQAQLVTYGRIAGRTGFVQEIEVLLKELKLSGIGPDQLQTYAQGEDTPALLAAKLKDLSLLYGAFEAWIASGYLDDADRLQLLDDVLGSELTFSGKSIWFHGFRSFTHVEWQLIRTLHEQAGQTTFSLGIPDTEAKAEVFAPVRRTLDRLTEMSHREGFLALVPCAGDGVSGNADLGDRVFSLNVLDGSTMKLMAEVNRCITPFQEIEAAAQVMLAWAQEMNWRWRDMMVVTPSDPIWQETLGRVCTRYGIPLYVDAKVPLSVHPMARYVLDLIAVAQSNLNGETVCRALKWGYAGVTREQAESLENHVLARGIRGYRWGYSQQAPPEIAAVMNWVADALGTLSRELADAADTAERTDRLIAYLNHSGIPEILDREREQLAEQGRLEEAQVQGQVWEQLLDILDQVKTLMGQESLTLDAYGEILQAGLETIEIGIIPPTGDQVSTGTLFRSRSSHVKGLIILGANEGQLPAYDSGDGLLLNEEKLLLVSRGMPLESDRDTRGSEEEYALYELLGKAEERIYVSCSLKDGSGERIQESWFFEKLVSESAVSPYQARQDTPGHPAAFMGLLADLKRESIPLKARQRAALERLKEHGEWGRTLRTVEAGHAHRYQVPALEGATVETLMGQSLILNATGLERYSRCPFAWFVRYGLRPQPRKAYTVEIPDMGTLFHAAVDRFIRQNKEDAWESWPPEAMAKALEPVVDDLARNFGHGILEDTARNRFLKKKVQRLSLRALGTLARQLQAGSFEIAGTELAFDLRPEMGGLPPLVLETDAGQKLVIQGRIDRVDLCPLKEGTYGRIIDYKSGRPRFSLSDFAQGLELQLAVYLDVLNQHGTALVPEGIIPAGFLYFYLDDPLVDPQDDTPETLERELYRELRMEGLLVEDLQVLCAMDEALETARQSAVIPVSLKQDGTPSAVSSVISQDAMAALLTYAEGVIRKNGTAILAGEYAVAPCQTEKGMACLYCDYMALCQYDPGAEETPRRILRKMAPKKALEQIMGGQDHGHTVDNGTK